MSYSQSLNDKIARYLDYWNRSSVKRPIIGFDIGGFFPWKRFRSLWSMANSGKIDVDSFIPENTLEDYDNFYRKSLDLEDDFIRGVAPISAIPWIEAMMDCKIRVGEASLQAEERKAPWDELEGLSLNESNKWFQKYLQFLKILVRHADGQYPVGQPILRGVTDLIGVLRGQTEILIDCFDNPNVVKVLSKNCTDVLIKIFQAQYDVVSPFKGGYFIEQYSLWAPDKIIRLQEDASALYSPDFYCEFIQENDRRLATLFPYNIIHLHPSSLFLLNHFLNINEINIFQINKDNTGMEIEELIPYLEKIQNYNRYLIIRGYLNLEDIKFIKRHLSPVGLIIQIVTNNECDATELNRLIKPLF